MQVTDLMRKEGLPVASLPVNGAAAPNVVERALAGIVSAKTILSTQYAPQVWAVPGLIPQGTTFIVGPPKLGKSVFVLGIAVAIASGGKALGSIDCEPGSVLYLALEDGPRRIQARLRAMTYGDFGDRLSIASTWPRLDQGGLEAINEWIERQPDARMIIVDTLKMLRPTRTADNQSVYNSDYDVIEPLTRLASERVALAIVHHTRKAIAEDPLASVSGSFGLTGAADGVLVLNRSRTRADASLSVIGRDLPEREMALRFDGVTMSWQAIGEAADVRRSAERQAIIDYLATSPAPVGPSTIAAALGRNADAIRQMLGQMLTKGEVELHSRGRYCLPVRDVRIQMQLPHNSIPSEINEMRPDVSIVSEVSERVPTHRERGQI